MKKIIYFLFIFIIVSCSGNSSKEDKNVDTSPSLVEGNWLLKFKISNDNIIPINFNLTKNDSAYQIEFSNSEERIVTNQITINGNKITISDPIFNTWFEGEIINSSRIKGRWFKDDKEYQIPFEAQHGVKERFIKPEIITKSTTNISGRWEVDFSKNNPEDHYKAIGQFIQDNNYLTGTFMTETGDYRFLEGNVYNDSIYLSCFDGAHLFLFKALLKNDTLFGNFWSGTHWEEPWIATKNNNFN